MSGCTYEFTGVAQRAEFAARAAMAMYQDLELERIAEPPPGAVNRDLGGTVAHAERRADFARRQAQLGDKRDRGRVAPRKTGDAAAYEARELTHLRNLVGPGFQRGAFDRSRRILDARHSRPQPPLVDGGVARDREEPRSEPLRFAQGVELLERSRERLLNRVGY